MTYKHIKWLILDFGNNYFINNIDFNNWVIKLNDNKKYFMVNFYVYDNLNYKTSFNDYKTYVINKLNINTNIDNDIINSNILTNYTRYNIIDLIYNDLIKHNNNMINLNIKKEHILGIPVFNNDETLYVCIINFSNILTRLLKLTINNTHIYDNTIFYLLGIKNGIEHYKDIEKVKGYSFNFITSLLNRIVCNDNLSFKEYNIDGFKFNLLDLIHSLNNKFPKFYIIFNSSTAKLDKTKQTFITQFYSLKDKTKRASKVNKIKNLNNILIQDIVNNTEIDLSLNFNKLSITNTNNKTKFMQLPIDNSNYTNRKNIHTTCKNITGSKHCYYSGYNDIIKSFDKFNLSFNK